MKLNLHHKQANTNIKSSKPVRDKHKLQISKLELIIMSR